MDGKSIEQMQADLATLRQEMTKLTETAQQNKPLTLPAGSEAVSADLAQEFAALKVLSTTT